MYTYRVDVVNMISVNTLCDARSMEQTMGERLRKARIDAGFASARSAAVKHRWSPSTYAAHENGQNDFKPDVAAKYAKAFHTSPAWLLTGETESRTPTAAIDGVEIVGIAGAGELGEIDFSVNIGTLGRAPAPIGWTVTTVALEVRGNSMRPMCYDGWYVYYDENKTEVTPDMIGEPCVICLEDDRVFIKIPYPGEGETFNLESVNPLYDTIRNARVRWAALITAFIPRQAAKRIAPPAGEAPV